MKPRLLCVVGPTASGKTSLAVSLAEALGGEVISCDSMQIYDRLSIGTAKPTQEEMRGIPHHLIGFADPRYPFSCADYAPLAISCAEELLGRGKLPVFCGGTGLYLDSVLKGTVFSDAGRGTEPAEETEALSSDSSVRETLIREYERDGIDAIYSRLCAVDAEAAAAIHPNNTRRVIRALEIYLVTGETKTAWDRRSHDIPSRYDACVIGLDYKDRTILHERINRRVDKMLAEGLLDEIRSLCAGGWLPEGSTAAQAIGYKEFLSCLRGEMTEEAAAEQVRAATRQYAKRQLTWFRRNREIHWLYPDAVGVQDGETPGEALLREALAVWRETGEQ